ncbi:unnamed protein product [Rotaria sp. Silwood1]|nr:unnamed protein product [Rotaria sp. Silwood1]
METILSSIKKELQLNDDHITNIYNFGSWVYGTNHEKSDRDFLIVMKIENSKKSKRLKFRRDFDYFHSFELKRLKNCDVTIHTCENFEILLEKNYMLAVECLFYPNEFILRNNIDYKTIYLSKYYNPLRLKQVIFYENNDSFKYIIDNDDNDSICSQSKSYTNPTIDQFLCDAIHTTTIDEDRLLKYLFHGLRYLDIGEQLIRTKSIDDFKRVTYVLYEMKDIYINNNKNIDFVIDYIRMKSDEYKTIINELVPTNIIDDTFEVHITVENCNMKEFLNICKINKLKPIFLHLINGNNIKQLITSLYHVGTYPNIIEQIKTLVDTKFRNFNIIRLKIESLACKDGVPENDIDKLLFWNKKFNYFEFRYEIFVKSTMEFKKLKQLCLYRDLQLAQNVFEKSSIDEMNFIVMMRLFNVGRINAINRNDDFIRYLTENNFLPSKIDRKFIVYDSNIDLDNRSTHVISNMSSSCSTISSNGPKYRIGFKNRKVFSRSTD